MPLLCHRGRVTQFPENSWEALTQIPPEWGVETDLRISRDGVIYCVHDSLLDRLFQRDLQVEATNSFLLDGLAIPRLTHLLEKYRNQPPVVINLELKGADPNPELSQLLVPTLLPILNQFPHLQDRFLITTSDDQLVPELQQEISPLYSTGLILERPISYAEAHQLQEQGFTHLILHFELVANLPPPIWNLDLKIGLFTFYHRFEASDGQLEHQILHHPSVQAHLSQLLLITDDPERLLQSVNLN